MKRKFSLAALLLAANPIAQAATETLDEVVVTATRNEQSLSQTLPHATVITRNDIETSQVADVPALLRTLAGIEVYQNGGIGKQHSLFMRGSNSSHTLVLLDGVRIGSATAGTTQIDQLMLDQIERIEVVRGNVSSLYGSEAIGGVIQIFTRRGKGEPSFNGSAGAGTHNTKRASAGFGGASGSTNFNVQLSKFKTDGVSAVDTRIVPTANPDADGYDNTSVSANLRHAYAADHSISASAFDSKADNQTDSSRGATSDVNSSEAHIQKYALLSENRLGENWQSRLQLSRGVDGSQNFLNGVPDLALGALFRTTSDLLSWQNTLAAGDNGALVVGVEKLKQQVASSTVFTHTSRTDDSLFAGYSGNIGRHEVQFNLRRDRDSDFGTANTWLVGVGHALGEAWRVTLSTATAFRAPTLNDLYYPYTYYGNYFGVDYSYVGNPNLKPERSRDSELGLHYAAEGQRLDMVYFDNRIRDLIVITTDPASTMVNLDEARSNGVELAYAGQFGDTGVKAAATWQDPRNARTGQTLLRRARHFSNVAVTQNFGTWQFGGEWQHSGARADLDINTFSRTMLDAYDVLNLTASLAIASHLELSARVDNLQNKDYMLAHGYNTPGRTLYLGLSYR